MVQRRRKKVVDPESLSKLYPLFSEEIDDDSEKVKGKEHDPITGRMKYDDPRKQEMWDWFFKHYIDPADAGVPYETSEGGYQYYNGGPYDAEEELKEEFGDKYPEDIINEVVDDITNLGVEWVRVGQY